MIYRLFIGVSFSLALQTISDLINAIFPINSFLEFYLDDHFTSVSFQAYFEKTQLFREYKINVQREEMVEMSNEQDLTGQEVRHIFN